MKVLKGFILSAVACAILPLSSHASTITNQSLQYNHMKRQADAYNSESCRPEAGSADICFGVGQGAAHFLMGRQQRIAAETAKKNACDQAIMLCRTRNKGKNCTADFNTTQSFYTEDYQTGTSGSICLATPNGGAYSRPDQNAD